MVACTTRKPFAEIRQAADARLWRSDNAASRSRRYPAGGSSHQGKARKSETGGVLFFLTYGRGRWLPLRIKERQWLTNPRAKLFESPHCPSRNDELPSAPRSSTRHRLCGNASADPCVGFLSAGLSTIRYRFLRPVVSGAGYRGVNHSNPLRRARMRNRVECVRPRRQLPRVAPRSHWRARQYFAAEATGPGRLDVLQVRGLMQRTPQRRLACRATP
jgi:hypothetical protein